MSDDETPSGTERVMAVRRQACDAARDVLFGLEYEPEDVLVVAEWLLHGTADLLLRRGEQMGRYYGAVVAASGWEQSSDAATWTPERDDPLARHAAALEAGQVRP